MCIISLCSLWFIIHFAPFCFFSTNFSCSELHSLDPTPSAASEHILCHTDGALNQQLPLFANMLLMRYGSVLTHCQTPNKQWNTVITKHIQYLFYYCQLWIFSILKTYWNRVFMGSDHSWAGLICVIWMDGLVERLELPHHSVTAMDSSGQHLERHLFLCRSSQLTMHNTRSHGLPAELSDRIDAKHGPREGCENIAALKIPKSTVSSIISQIFSNLAQPGFRNRGEVLQVLLGFCVSIKTWLLNFFSAWYYWLMLLCISPPVKITWYVML